MEFTQHLDAYEHAQCVDLFKWKCLICSLEAKDQVGLKMHHISDGVVYTDEINGSNWSCCHKCKSSYHLGCVTPGKEENIMFPFFAPLMSAGSRQLVKQIDLPQVGNQVGNDLFTVVRQKITKKKVRRAKDGRTVAPRKAASALKYQKEQQWKVEDLDKAFELWEGNKDLPLQRKVVKEQDSKENRHPLHNCVWEVIWQTWRREKRQDSWWKTLQRC